MGATVSDEQVLVALRGEQAVAEVCRAAAVTEAGFREARDAFLKRRLPPVEARLGAAVEGSVEILRDGAGVPHVFAKSDADLWFGAGFAMAQDRLWQMERLRRRALGTLAEVLGPEHVASDLQHRIVDLAGIAAAEAARLEGEARVAVEALAMGINRGIAAFGAELPVEFAILDYDPELFTPRDVMAILRGIWWSLNGRLPMLSIAEATFLLPEALQTAYLTPAAPEERILPPSTPLPPAGLAPEPLRPVVAGEGDWRGSNNWAVAGSRTASGYPILCSDPHQPFWLPSSWYEYVLHGPDRTVAGAGHPGTPGMLWGSNGQVTWGLTNDGTSTRDLYREEVHPEDPSLYRDGDEWQPFAQTPIEISVRGEAAGPRTVRATVRGPIVNDFVPSISEAGDPPLSLRWVGQEPIDDVGTMLAIAQARTCDEFRAALSGWAVPVFNWVFADRDGQVGYQNAGRIPIRGRIKAGYRDAANPEDAWQGYVPFAAMPKIERPADGYVASANNRAHPDGYPYPLYGPNAPGYREERIREVINSTSVYDISAAKALQNDVVSRRAARLCPPLIARLADSIEPDIATLVERLREWDYAYIFEATAPLFFETFMSIWQEKVAAARFPQRLVGLVKGQTGPAAGLIERDDLAWFSDGTAEPLLATARETVGWIREHHGDDPSRWQWRLIHTAHWRHALSNGASADVFDLGPRPIPGCADTVCNTGTGTGYDLGVIGGVEYRLLADLATPDRILTVQNAGNSGQPLSPHYADGLEPWIEGGYRTISLTRAGVEADLTGRTVLEP